MSDAAAAEALAQFSELQNEYNTTHQKLKQAAYDTRSRQVELQRSKLTVAELEPMPESVKTYVSLGRAFVAKDRTKLMTALKEQMTQATSDIQTLVATQEKLGTRAKEVEKEIKELLTTNEALARRIAR